MYLKCIEPVNTLKTHNKVDKIFTLGNNTPANSLQFNGQSGGVPNYWTSQSVPQGTPSYYNPYSQQNTHFNNDNNQLQNYEQNSPILQTYNNPHNLNIPQKFSRQQQQHYQPIPPGPLNFNSKLVNQQFPNMQYTDQYVNSQFKQPPINQKYDNQQPQTSQSYNLHQTPHYIGKIKPPPPKEYQTQSPPSLNHPISDKELPYQNQDYSLLELNDTSPPLLMDNTQDNFIKNISEFHQPTENQLPTSKIPSQSSSDLLEEDPSSPQINIMQNKNDSMPLNSLSGYSDSESDPYIINLKKNEKNLTDSLQTDLQTSINPENNDNLNPFNKLSKNQDYSLLKLNDISAPLLMDNMQVENVLMNDPQKGDFIKNISEFHQPTENQLPTSKIPSQSSSDLLEKDPSSPQINIMQNKNDGMPLNSLSGYPDSESDPFIINLKKNEKILTDSLQTDLQTSMNPENNDNLNPFNKLSKNQDYSLLKLNDTSAPLLMDNTQVGNVLMNDSQKGDFIKNISIFHQPTENQLPLPQMASQSNLELLDKSLLTPNTKTTVIDKLVNSELDHLYDSYYLPTQNQSILSEFSPSALISNPLQPSKIPSQSSLELLDKGPSSPNINIIQSKNDGVSLNSLSEFPNGKSEPLTSDVIQDENILIDNSQIDLQTFLNPENNDNLNPLNKLSENQEDSLLKSPPLLMNNTQVGNVVMNDDIQELQPLNETTLPFNIVDTQLNEELILEKSMSESPVLLDNEDNDSIYSLEDLVFNKSLETELSKYAKSDIVSSENPEKANQDEAKISVFANPNDIHTLEISPTQPSTSDYNYSKNNHLIKLPPADVPWYNSSFPNSIDYIQQSDLNDNNDLLSPLLNVNRYPSFYNQIPMYPPNNNDYNQQNAYSADGQNQITSIIQLPGFSSNVNHQPISNKKNTGCIYKKVDLRKPPPDSSNSWLLLNKDYTRNSNQNNGYTNYDSKTRTSAFGTPSTSHQINIQDISNLPSNDMFVENMMPMNSLHVPLVETSEIFGVTLTNFPRASFNQILLLTNAIIQSVMRSLQQLNTAKNTVYGHRSKRDVNPSGNLYNLRATLIDKYSQDSTITPTGKYMNEPYYTQPDTTGKQPKTYFASQPIESMLQQRQQQMYYGDVTDMNHYGSKDNNNISMPQLMDIQSYVLKPIYYAILSAIRSNMPYPYLFDTPEVKIYAQKVNEIIQKVFKNQIIDILYGRPPTMNV